MRTEIVVWLALLSPVLAGLVWGLHALRWLPAPALVWCGLVGILGLVFVGVMWHGYEVWRREEA